MVGRHPHSCLPAAFPADRSKVIPPISTVSPPRVRRRTSFLLLSVVLAGVAPAAAPAGDRPEPSASPGSLDVGLNRLREKRSGPAGEQDSSKRSAAEPSAAPAPAARPSPPAIAAKSSAAAVPSAPSASAGADVTSVRSFPSGIGGREVMARQ